MKQLFKSGNMCSAVQVVSQESETLAPIAVDAVLKVPADRSEASTWLQTAGSF